MEMSAQVLLNRASTEGNIASNANLLTEIRNASSRMRSFVKSFLANTASDHKIQIKLGVVDLVSAAATVVRQYEPTARAKQIDLRTFLPSDGHLFAEADPHALAQVLDNLVSNAIKFSPLGREVVVTVRSTGGKMEFQVRDRGPGLTDEDKIKLFGRYARLSARPTGGEPSTGLGLSIARKLTQAMGGELVCESKTGQGATFTLRLSPVPPKSTNTP
jgi:two-component system sensor histidine kinase/response regulator